MWKILQYFYCFTTNNGQKLRLKPKGCDQVMISTFPSLSSRQTPKIPLAALGFPRRYQITFYRKCTHHVKNKTKTTSRKRSITLDDIINIIESLIIKLVAEIQSPLQSRHNERDGVSDHQPHDCLLNCLFRRRSKKTSVLRVTGL